MKCLSRITIPFPRFGAVLRFGVVLWLGLSVAPLAFADTSESKGDEADSKPAKPKSAKPGIAASASDMTAYSQPITGSKESIDMVPIKVGTPGFPSAGKLGSPESETGRKSDEGPVVEVTVEPFWMAKVEVTWDIYNEFRKEYPTSLDRRLDPSSAPAADWVDAVSIPTPLWEQDAAPILQGLGQEGGFPVADISQYAALQFTKWLSKKTGRFYRLPTEAEWEYAARAGTSTAYFFGDDPKSLGEYAWTFDNSEYEDLDKGYPGAGAGYRKVGLKKASPWGLHDIYGNVSEWVIDQYLADGYERIAALATAEKKPSFLEAVVWPTKIFPCVARGGNWESDAAECRSAARLASDRKWQRRDPQIPKSLWWCTDAFHVGFRVVRPLREPSVAEQTRFWDPKIKSVERILRGGGKELRVKIEQKK